MRVTSIRDIRTSVAGSLLPADLLRTTLLNGFKSIEYGRLVIADGDEVFEFGQPTSEASMTAHIDVLDKRLYSMVIQKGIIGSAEAYMQGMWQSPSLLNVIRIMVKNMDMLNEMDKAKTPIRSLILKLYGLLHINDLDGSKKNISAHYDLGNDFFSLFLDKHMMYSSAVYRDKHQTLEQAAEYKLDLICQKLDLNEQDHVVEIGTGWGGFACYAAQHYGCKVTTTTISKEQYDRAVERVNEQQLQDKVTVLFEDYRKLEGQYDKLVSIEMIEAVGHEYYAEYFRQCSHLLKEDGQMLIQAILMSDQRYDMARKNVDFIKRYIFPGGCLPSYNEICNNVTRHTDLQITDVDDITYDYAKTLADWREQFFAHLPQVREQGFSDEFIRMWEYYLCYCQGGFMERTIHTAQIVFAKPHWRDPRYPVA